MVDRTLARYALLTFIAYIVSFKTIEYLIAFTLDDALVTALNQNEALDAIVGLILSTIAFGVAFWLVAARRVDEDGRIVALYMAAPFVLVGLIAIGRGLTTGELIFRLIFISIVFFLSQELLKRFGPNEGGEDPLDSFVIGPTRKSFLDK